MKILHSTVFRITIVVLLICEVASLPAIFSRLNTYASLESQNVIPLTESNGITKVTCLSNANEFESSSLKVYDSNTVWHSETNVELFKLAYDGKDETTVQSANVDRLIAPGTSNRYTFSLENTGNTPLEYEMSTEVYINGIDFSLPISVNMCDGSGKYILGSNSNKVDVSQLNYVDVRERLSSGELSNYTIEWQWEYEGNTDIYDTALGNLAIDNDVTLTVKILVNASMDTNKSTLQQYGSEDYVSSPKTSDSLNLKTINTIMVSALVVMLFTSNIRTIRNMLHERKIF